MTFLLDLRTQLAHGWATTEVAEVALPSSTKSSIFTWAGICFRQLQRRRTSQVLYYMPSPVSGERYNELCRWCAARGMLGQFIACFVLWRMQTHGTVLPELAE